MTLWCFGSGSEKPCILKDSVNREDARAGSAVSRKSKKASLIPMKAKHPEDRESSFANDQYHIRGRKDGKKGCQGLIGKTMRSFQCLDSRESQTLVDVMRIKTMNLCLWERLKVPALPFLSAIPVLRAFPISLYHPKRDKSGFALGLFLEKNLIPRRASEWLFRSYYQTNSSLKESSLHSYSGWLSNYYQSDMGQEWSGK